MEQNKVEKQTNQQNSYLVVIFGPPASGKTTLARHIKQNYENCFENKNTCILVSADCFEQYLVNHSTSQLVSLLQNRQGWEWINTLKIKRKMFQGEKWKESRQFIKNSLHQWLKRWKTVILEDDFLLKSQRKQLRQIVEYTQTKYIEINISITLSECLSNLKKRSVEVSQEQTLVPQILQKAFDKFQIDPNPYCFSCSIKQAQHWSFITENAKKVFINHPQLKQKALASQQNILNDLAQIQIRAYVSQVMRSQDLRQKYFKEKSLKEIAAFLSKLKKNYKPKVKSLTGFVAYIQSETNKLL